jgi:hypothetical protein
MRPFTTMQNVKEQLVTGKAKAVAVGMEVWNVENK